MRTYSFLEQPKRGETKVKCFVNGKPISDSDAQKILLRAAADMVVEKLRKLGRLSEKKQS
jgi:hypothetical protein